MTYDDERGNTVAFMLGMVAGMILLFLAMLVFNYEQGQLDRRYCNDFARHFVLESDGTWECQP